MFNLNSRRSREGKLFVRNAVESRQRPNTDEMSDVTQEVDVRSMSSLRLKNRIVVTPVCLVATHGCFRAELTYDVAQLSYLITAPRMDGATGDDATPNYISLSLFQLKSFISSLLI